MDRDIEFREYVAGRRPQLYRSAYLLCGDPHRAEDVVQDALVRLYVAWPRAVRANNVDAYARRIVLNSHYDQTRRPWRREKSVAAGPERAAPEEFPAEDAQTLREAIRRLPDGQRKVVILRHIWGLSVEETAADLGISPGTVKSQTSDALSALRRALASEFDNQYVRKEEDR